MHSQSAPFIGSIQFQRLMTSQRLGLTAHDKNYARFFWCAPSSCLSLATCCIQINYIQPALIFKLTKKHIFCLIQNFSKNQDLQIICLVMPFVNICSERRQPHRTNQSIISQVCMYYWRYPLTNFFVLKFPILQPPPPPPPVSLTQARLR